MSAACKRDFIICLQQEGAVSVPTSSLPGECLLLLYLFLSLTLLRSGGRSVSPGKSAAKTQYSGRKHLKKK